MKRIQTRETVLDTYLSTAELVEMVGPELERTVRDDFYANDRFAGGTWKEARELAAHGWQEGLAQSLPIIEEALELIEREMPATAFEAEWEKTGSEVDIARFMTGQPENMIEYVPIHISKVGRIVTLNVSICTSSAISTQTIIKRGAVLTGLALALEKLQHPVEIWAEFTVGTRANIKNGISHASVRVLVKGAHDSVDPAHIAYWLGHPTSQRRWAFAGCIRIKQEVPRGRVIPRSLGTPTNAKDLPEVAREYPEGTLFTPSLWSGRDVPEAATYILETLRELGLLA